MIPTNKPKNTLNGIEFLLVSIQSHPGKSQRFHLRRLYQYQHGKRDYHKGGTNCGYFISKSYRDVVWEDRSEQSVFYECCQPVDGRHSKFYNITGSILQGFTGGYKSKSSKMYLTKHGIKRANKARIKLGLKPV